MKKLAQIKTNLLVLELSDVLRNVVEISVAVVKDAARKPTKVLEKCKSYLLSSGTVVKTMLLVALKVMVSRDRIRAAYIKGNFFCGEFIFSVLSLFCGGIFKIKQIVTKKV